MTDQETLVRSRSDVLAALVRIRETASSAITRIENDEEDEKIDDCINRLEGLGLDAYEANDSYLILRASMKKTISRSAIEAERTRLVDNYVRDLERARTHNAEVIREAESNYTQHVDALRVYLDRELGELDAVLKTLPEEENQ